MPPMGPDNYKIGRPTFCFFIYCIANPLCRAFCDYKFRVDLDTGFLGR